MTTPMSAERFSDRFRYYRDQPQQQCGVQQLFEAISSTESGEEILCEQAAWALTYSEEPQPQPSRSLLLVVSIPAVQRKPAWPGRRWPPLSNPVIPTCL
jgi:tagatose-1,6-bisphosphate aldolase non-catalytic subunit AgaZ/GatZ